MGIIAKLLLLAAGGWTAKQLFSGGSSTGGGVIIPTVWAEFIPQDVEPGVTKFKLAAEEEVGKSGGSQAETFELTLYELDKGESIELDADVAMTAFVEATNKFYVGAAGHQFCEGVRVHVDATRTATGVALSNVSQEPNAQVCADQVTPGKEDLSGPWPYAAYGKTYQPKLEVIASADAVVLRVTAPALRFSAVPVEPGKGYGPDFWAKTGPYRYTFRISGASLVKSTA